MTADNNLPVQTEPQPGTGSSLGPSLFRTPALPGTLPTVTGVRGLSKLETDVKNLAEGVRRAAKSGLDSDRYRKAKSRYETKLAELNRERGKAGLNQIISIEQLDLEKAKGSITSDVNQIQNQIAVETALGNTNKVKELEQELTEARALKTTSVSTPAGFTGMSQTGYGGKVPDITQSQPILNEDGTITVVDANNKPISIGKRTLESVYIVFDEKNFYERGVKSTIKSVDYRNQEELIQLAYSFKKEDRKKLQEAFKKVNLLPSSYNANGELDRDSAFESAFLTAHVYANQVNYNRLVNNQPFVGILDAISEYKTDADKEPRVSRNISEFSISDAQAEALLEDFYTQALGVRPGKNDIEKFKDIVRKKAIEKPRVVQTTASADNLTTTTKTIEEGFDEAGAQLLARRQAEARPEFAPYQMATSFYDSILRAAQSPVNIQGPPS